MTAVGISPDGLSVSIGTENGSLGILDVPTQQYRTILQSHTDTVHALAVRPDG